jgi:hypothetical protein
MASTFYMLNPGGDLPATQAAFETLFTGQPQWRVGFPRSLGLLVRNLQRTTLVKLGVVVLPKS